MEEKKSSGSEKYSYYFSVSDGYSEKEIPRFPRYRDVEAECRKVFGIEEENLIILKHKGLTMNEDLYGKLPFEKVINLKLSTISITSKVNKMLDKKKENLVSKITNTFKAMLNERLKFEDFFEVENYLNLYINKIEIYVGLKEGSFSEQKGSGKSTFHCSVCDNCFEGDAPNKGSWYLGEKDRDFSLYCSDCIPQRNNLISLNPRVILECSNEHLNENKNKNKNKIKTKSLKDEKFNKTQKSPINRRMHIKEDNNDLNKEDINKKIIKENAEKIEREIAIFHLSDKFSASSIEQAKRNGNNNVIDTLNKIIKNRYLSINEI